MEFLNYVFLGKSGHTLIYLKCVIVNITIFLTQFYQMNYNCSCTFYFIHVHCYKCLKNIFEILLFQTFISNTFEKYLEYLIFVFFIILMLNENILFEKLIDIKIVFNNIIVKLINLNLIKTKTIK